MIDEVLKWKDLIGKKIVEVKQHLSSDGRWFTYIFFDDEMSVATLVFHPEIHYTEVRISSNKRFYTKIITSDIFDKKEEVK